jgi:hypothetical protein
LLQILRAPQVEHCHEAIDFGPAAYCDLIRCMPVPESEAGCAAKSSGNLRGVAQLLSARRNRIGLLSFRAARRGARMISSRNDKIILLTATVAVTAAVIAAIVVLGSPAAQRRQRLDSARLDDLERIDRLVASFALAHGTVPDSIESLVHEPGYSVPRDDPESRTPYEYRRLGPDSFELCATFYTDSASNTLTGPYALSVDATWTHGPGRRCFDRRADIARK